MATEQALAPSSEPTGPIATFRAMGQFFKRNLTRRSAAAVAIWRVEVWMATPLALLFVATLGRWEGALAMGVVMAAYAAVFLFLLDGERVVEEMRAWTGKRRWTRWLTPHEAKSRRHHWLLLPALVMLTGPFWRAVAFHVTTVPRTLAYATAVGGSFPHALFWTGLVVGGLYEGAIRPAFGSLF
ncbi:MAG: hypothetical protein ABIP58_08245 [Dehalococcoidia bacterium]